MGVNNAWAATIFNCGIEVNETWYKGTGTINSGNWLESNTAFNNKDFGVITSLKLGGQYDTWDNNQTDNCSWNASNGITITIKKGSTQKDQFKLSCYHSGKDGNNNVWKTTGTIGQCGDKNAYGRYTHNISQYAAGNDYTIAAMWFSPSGKSTTGTAKFTIPGFTTTSKSQTFDSTPVGNNNSKTISFGTHYGTSLKTNNCSISGTNHTEFSVTSINESGVTVQFKPTSVGSKTATLTITDAHSKKCTITLSGTATLPTYTVTFNANGHGTAPAAQPVSQGSKATKPADLTATGYTFGGWYKESNCTNAFDFNTAINANITLYAKWTENTYTVTINNDGHGTTTPSGAQSNVGQVTGLSITANAKNGYQFEEWSITNGNGSFTSTTATTTTFKPTVASTIQANFSPINYTITYENLYGVSHSNPTTYNIETTTITFASPTSERTGYTFNGWNPASIAQGSTNNKTVTAQWTAKTYTVTLDANGGTSSTTSVTATYDAEMPKITPPTRTGYTFNGYFDAQSGGTKYYKADGTSAQKWDKTSNTTLYAQWTINTYTITYGVVGEAHGTILLNRGDEVTTSASTTANYDTEHTFTAAPADGYKIAGWYSDANGTNNIADGTSNTYLIASLTANTDVYVKFMEKAEVMYDVTVNATEGGTVNTIGTVPVGNKTPSTFTATPAPGYRFDEWTYTGGIRTSGSLTNSSIDITANGTGTLTAHFTRVHTVNFFATPAAAGTATATVNSNAITSGDKLDANTTITFTAAVANAYNGQCTFVRWVDGAGTPLSNNATYTHTVKEDITVKAIFKITQYTLTFSAGDGGFVSAKANNSNIASPANLDYNTSVTLTAEPDAGCAFVKWVDGADKQLSTNATYTIDLKSNQTVKAVFNKGTTVYMKAIEYWKKDHPRYAIYYWGAGDKNGWVDMTNVDCNGDIYEGYVPAGYTNFKFVRLAPSTSNDWANKWNETPDLTTTSNAEKMYIQPHVYLKPNSNWTQSNARFAAYFYADGKEAKWNSMNDLDGDGVYSCEIPTGYTSFILCRMNPAFDTNNWDKDGNDYVWNQTSDLAIQNDGTNKYTVKEGTWDQGGGTWSYGPHKNGWQDYAEPSYKITYPTNGTITVTKAGETVANGTSLNMGDEIKITFTPADGDELINYNVDYATGTGEEGVYSVCGPTKITAEFAKAGTARTVYLRPNEDWLRDEPIFAAYAWNSKNNKQNHWYIMTTKADDYTGAYSCNISSTYDMVIFARLKPAGRDGSDGSLKFENAWNQTKDLAIIDKDNDKTNDHKLRFAIGDKVGGDGNDKNHYDGAWEENTPIWGMVANFNDWKAEKAVFKGYPGHLDVMPPFGTSHAFKLYNFFGVKDQSEYFGNAGTMKRANSGQWWTMEATEHANCQMTLDVKGDYIYQMRFLTVGTELRKQISVTYPAAEMYYIMYEETGENDAVKQRISYGIRLTGEERLDTVSFFVDVTKSAKIYILDGNQNKVGDPYTIVGTIGQNPTGAQAPQRRAENNPELLIEEGCGITESGVYNFVAQQDANNEVTLLINDWHAYTGAYYIRTDAASGGWGGYKQNGNKMTYTSYADKNHNFDHYYCKWITSSSSSYANVKFCVANDYSHKLSDELDGDEIIEKAGVHTGCLPEDANVRFGWDSKTNELSRAYISGSAEAKDRFLVLTGNESLLDLNDKPFKVTGLKANEQIFDDMGNWLYQLDVKANTQTAIKLTAQFNNRVQTFFGDARAAADGKEMIDATTPEYHKVRMIYNFKTNHLLVAWLLDPQQQVNNENVASDVLIIREDHGDANQLQFKQDLTQMAVKTAYATITFTKDHVTDTEKSQWLRYEYWVSFPFNVKISDVFGFGEYGTEWIMQLYDGAERAEKGNWIDSPTFWKYITNRNYTLKAGVGYVLKLQASKMTDKTAFMYSDKVSLYFPSTPNDAGNTIISATPDTQHEIPEHACTIDRDNRNIYDSHWNLIGVPGYANIANFNTDASLSPVEYKNGEVSFYYEYNAADNTYQATSAKSNFKNMHSYMVQFAGIINWSTPETPTQLAARRNSDTELEKRTLRLEIAQGEEVADQTFVQLQQEGATPEFDMNLDLTKIINSGANIYTLAGDARIQVAGNALPVAETTIPVGVQMATAGEYTFRMPDGTEGMVVELIDYETNTRTNLLLSDYTTTLPAGSFENRFALIVKPDKVATDVENIGQAAQNGEAAKKYIIDGKLYLQKGGLLYDAQGHIVR